ncbi:hypothetical protein [Haladaptatus sp. YSMS36]|uniref:hypothetical protein n=1 Tax=Haladaptatus sp. YSMS36 TaxID=3033384 RepID=UPI0023E849FE|nr:hypothetical protein [Haladaptatus sp. YSMS36]
MKERVTDWIENLSWADLVVGAILGVVIGSLAAPIVGPVTTDLYKEIGIYDGPNVETNIQQTGEYHPVGEPVEEFDGLVWKESYDVYRIEIVNTNERPVDRLKLTWRAPGCIVQSNTEGEMVHGPYWLHDRYALEVSSESKLAINEMDCTQVLEMTEGSLGQDERLVVEFVVTRKFDECDVLVDSNPVNQHELMYRWSVNDVQFMEERIVSPSSLESEYAKTRNISIVGTRERFVTRSGEKGQHYVVGKRGDTFTEAIQQCGASNERK